MNNITKVTNQKSSLGDLGICFFFFLFCFSSLSAQVQEEDSTVTRNITVEREYQPVIQDAGKINSLPYFIEPKVTRINPQYTTNFNKPLSVDQNIHYLAPAELALPQKKQMEGFARAAIGTGFNSLADFAFPLVKKSDMKLDFILNHYGLFNKKAHSATQAAFAFDKKFKTIDFYAGIGGGHEYFKYYGDSFNAANSIIDFSTLNNGIGGTSYLPTSGAQIEVEPYSLATLPGKNNLWRLNINTGIRTSPTTEDLRYGVYLDYDLFTSKNGITEQQIELNANIDAEVAGNRLGVEIASNNQFYTTSNSSLEDALKNYYVLFINPYYSFEKEAFDLRVGVKSSFSFAHGRGFSPSPDIRFEWRAVPQYLALYAGAIGEYKINTLNSIYMENCYLNPDVLVDDTYTPINFYFGVKIKPVTGLLVDAFFDYKIIKDQYFFVNKEYKISPFSSLSDPAYEYLYTNRFEAVYSDANQLRIGGRISYNHQNKFNAQLALAYNHWSVDNFEYAWNKPAFEMDLSTSFHITPKLNAYANMYLAGKRYAKISDIAVEMKTKVDINLGASYAIKDWISAFLRVNNLINNKYEQWHGYEAQGFNVMAGAAFNF